MAAPVCFTCQRPGHIAPDCPDELPAAASKEEHLARIDGYVSAWASGKITLEQKRRAISDENLAYYGAACPRRLIWP